MRHAEGDMPKTRTTAASLAELFHQSSRPAYAVDAKRRVVYCNPALAAWMELESARIVGRLVEYHSEPYAESDRHSDLAAPLTDLCPPPKALAGLPCSGTISCSVQEGRLVHRRAEFIPLPATEPRAKKTAGYAVLVLLDLDDLSPHELTAEVSADTTSDELHRTIRRFRREQAAAYSIESLLGTSAAMQKVRVQVAAAAKGGANTLVRGYPGSGRGHIARATHYAAAADSDAKLVPVDCQTANDETLRRALDTLRSHTGDLQHHRPTLLLENVDCLEPPLQRELLNALRNAAFRARIVATCGPPQSSTSEDVEPPEETAETLAEALAGALRRPPGPLEHALVELISTVTIEAPRLNDRIEDLPVLAQYFLESCNRAGPAQVGSVRADALDRLALYTWPGELDELRAVIAAAHAACQSHEITPEDLPAVIHHAQQAASRSPKRAERIVLDDLLAKIEREAIERALAQANGNKTEAAELLGMTRPRLYRRLVQLGLVTETKDEDSQVPEFIEDPSDEEAP